MSKTKEVLFYGVISKYPQCKLVAVTAQKSARYGSGRWYGRLLRPGVSFEDAASTNGTSSFIAQFATREEAEAAYKPILASQDTFSDEVRDARKVYDAAFHAAHLRHEERVAAIPGVRKPAS